jgi:hypothetical protein
MVLAIEDLDSKMMKANKKGGVHSREQENKSQMKWV